MPASKPSLRLPAPKRRPTCDVVLYARNTHSPTTVSTMVDPTDRPASACPPICPTMAVSMSTNAGSAISCPNVGMASVRMVPIVVHDALFAVSVS